MPGHFQDDTIAAVATPAGEGGIAVIRLSGPDSLRIASKVFFPKSNSALETFPSHTIHLGEICSPFLLPCGAGDLPAGRQGLGRGKNRTSNGQILDQALASIFRAPHSYTGEDVIELSLHGGSVLAAKVLKVVLDAGARLAEPGEFTRRAFLNGKLDLTQAEAVLDLIKSKSDLSIETAMRQLSGALSGRLKNLKDRLMKLYAHMEAFLDFPEEDLEIYEDQEMGRQLQSVGDEIESLIGSFQRGALLREGAILAIAGKPNVGKSSLFNALLERDRALVSEHAGTTRDTLEEWLEIRGLSIRLVDTAGLMHEAVHPLDKMGVERAKVSLRSAQAYLFVVDGSEALGEEDRQAFETLQAQRPVILVVNKADLKNRLDRNDCTRLLRCARNDEDDKNWIEVSSKTRQGFDQLEEKIFETLIRGRTAAGEEQITRLRHRKALESALQFLRRAAEAFRARASLELVIFDLKQAIDALKELVGEIYSEDLLDVIFSEFCIGK